MDPKNKKKLNKSTDGQREHFEAASSVHSKASFILIPTTQVFSSCILHLQK